MSTDSIKVIFGGAAFMEPREPDFVNRILDTLEQGKVSTIDTATLYGVSEETLGKAGAPKRFIIDTKVQGGFNQEGHGGSKDNVLKEAEQSKARLGAPVDVYYIHAPDADTPIEETLEAVNEVYKSGFFKRFGLSNFQAEDVEKIYNLAKEKGYPLPEVYQGNYSAVARRQEEVLFPTLRKLGMSFYAYSPLAGGFLSKSKEQIQDGAGRFNTEGALSSLYTKLYHKSSYIDALEQWESIAKDEGITKADLAYRWVRYNSSLESKYGDSIIIGASKVEQLEQTLGSINAGPLSENAMKRIDQVWDTLKHEAPLDNFHF